jgi:hypothetical protein
MAGLALLLLLLPVNASAAVKTWDGGCGAESSWSCASNWSDNAVPGAEDTVTFNATSSTNSTVDPGFAGVVANVNVAAGYTGTITLGRSFTVSTSFSQAAGTFTAANLALTTASFTLSGGHFTASSGTTSIGRAMTISGTPTFAANGGTVEFNGTASATLRCDHVGFNLVKFTHAAGIKTVNADCNLPLGASPSATGGGSITLNGTLSGSGTLTTGGLLTLGKTGGLSGFSGLSSSRLTVNGAYDFGSYSPFAVGGAFKLNAGSGFTAPAGTASFAAAFTVSSKAAFVAGEGTVDFAGTSGALACGGKSFNLVELTNVVGTKTVGSDCDLPLGADPSATNGSITLNGTLSGSGTLTTGGLLTLGKTGGLSGFSGLASSRLTVSGAYDFGSYSSFAVSGAFTLGSEASFTAPSATASFGAGFKLNPGSTFVAGSGTVDFDGEASGTLSCNEANFNLVVFTHTRGSKVVGGNCTLPLGDDPTLGASANASVTLDGALSGSGTLTALPPLTFDSTAKLIGFTGFTSQSGLILAGASLDFGSYGSFDLEGNYRQNGGAVSVPNGAYFAGAFTLSNGATFNAPAGVATFAAKFLLSKGSIFNADGGTIDFGGPTNGTISCNNTAFHQVVFSHAIGTKTVNTDCNLPLGTDPSAGSGGSITLNGTLSGSGTLTTGGLLTLGKTGGLSGFTGLSADALAVDGAYDFGSYGSFAVGGDFTIDPSGSFKAPTGEARFAGDFTSAPESTFVANGGTVVLDGTAQTVAGDTTFNNFRKVVSFPDTLAFRAGDTQTIEGQLRLQGKDAGNLLSLASSEPGTPWSIDREGTAEVAFVSVADSTNIGTPIVAEESSDGGGNNGWIFPGPATEFVLEAQTTTPTAGATDNLTITAKDSLGNTATSYTGSHSLSFGPVSDSPSGAHATVTSSAGAATNFGAATAISFSAGVASVSGANNGQMTLVKAGATQVTVTDGSISNGAGLAVTVSPATAASLSLAAATTTPTAGATDNLTITAKDSLGNTATSYTGSHNLSFGPVSDSPSGAHATVTSSAGAATNFGAATAISFSEGVASVSGANNGQMTLVKAGATQVTVTDGSISNGAGLAVTVSPGTAARIAWTHATSTGTLSSPCLFTCTGTGLGTSGNFKANVSITDSSGNTVSALGSGHAVTVTAPSGTIAGGALTIPSTGAAESTTQFTYTPNKNGAITLTAATSSGTVYTSATASITR